MDSPRRRRGVPPSSRGKAIRLCGGRHTLKHKLRHFALDARRKRPQEHRQDGLPRQDLDGVSLSTRSLTRTRSDTRISHKNTPPAARRTVSKGQGPRGRPRRPRLGPLRAGVARGPRGAFLLCPPARPPGTRALTGQTAAVDDAAPKENNTKRPAADPGGPGGGRTGSRRPRGGTYMSLRLLWSWTRVHFVLWCGGQDRLRRRRQRCRLLSLSPLPLLLLPLPSFSF